jgi:CubicO group peptidase (beta-lactamase class C family)
MLWDVLVFLEFGPAMFLVSYISLQYWILLTLSDFWENFGKKHPAYEPWFNPLYSNSAYIVMGFIIERVSGQTLEEFM